MRRGHSDFAIHGGGHPDYANFWRTRFCNPCMWGGGPLVWLNTNYQKTPEIAQIRPWNTCNSVIKKNYVHICRVVTRFCQSSEGGSSRFCQSSGGGAQILPILRGRHPDSATGNPWRGGGGLPDLAGENPKAPPPVMFSEQSFTAVDYFHSLENSREQRK